MLGLPWYLTDRGSPPPLAGFIGYELLERFAVPLDYDAKTLTLAPNTAAADAGMQVRRCDRL